MCVISQIVLLSHELCTPPLRNHRYGTETVSHEVLSRMKALMMASAASAASHSFLLDEDSALPFTQEDIATQMDDKVRCCVGTDT